MRLILYTILSLFYFNTYAQELKVLDVSKAFNENKKVIKKDKLLPINSKITIKNGGSISLQSSTGWIFRLNEGHYNLDSCYIFNKNIYTRYDSLKVIIDKKFPNGISCKFKNLCIVDGRKSYQDQYFENGNIAFKNVDYKNIELSAGTDTITIKWRDQEVEKKTYYILIKNFYDEIIDYKITDSKQILIDFKDYKYKIDNLDSIIITVISEDCKSSSILAIGR